jgi:hypothetical protein
MSLPSACDTFGRISKASKSALVISSDLGS